MPPPFLKQAGEVLPPALPVSETSLLQMGPHGSQNNSPSPGSFLWFVRGVDGFFSAHHHTGHCRQFVYWDLWSNNSLICFCVLPSTCREPAGCETGTLGVFTGWTLSSGPPCSGPASLGWMCLVPCGRLNLCSCPAALWGFLLYPASLQLSGQQSLGPGSWVLVPPKKDLARF